MGYYEKPGFWNTFSDMPVFIQLFFGLVILLIAGTFLWAIIYGLYRWTKNNHSPIVTHTCRVVGKRTRIRGGSGDSRTSTDYYLTFELDDRSRLEFEVRDHQYGLTVEGDYGELTYQGTRFKSFTRLAEPNPGRF